MVERPDTLIVDGRRLDGRRLEDLRPLVMATGVVPRADGSARVERGQTKLVASVFGPRELGAGTRQEAAGAVVRCTISMPGFASPDAPVGGDERGWMAASLSDALGSLALLDAFPGCSVDVLVQVVQADAGVLATALTAASLAMADAGIPMRDRVGALSFGVIHDARGGPHLALDLAGLEEAWSQATCTVAFSQGSRALVLLQSSGAFPPGELERGLSLAQRVSEQVDRAQRDALARRYGGVGE